jgi:uncharacterized protein YlaI
MGGHLLPQWVDRARPLAGAILLIAPAYLLTLLYYGGSPQTTNVGYAPEQPVFYSHALHVGQLGLDCRYCHNTVETAAHAAVPPTSVCMNCHSRIATDSSRLLPVRQSAADGSAIRWLRVHDLPDYVYFDHSAHVTRGVGCVECHGRVDKMERVTQVEPLSMSWCLDCHRDPAPRLRPRDQVTNMAWEPAEDRRLLGKRLAAENNIHPSTDCSTCHR